jgi:hypothetical protein
MNNKTIKIKKKKNNRSAVQPALGKMQDPIQIDN